MVELNELENYLKEIYKFENFDDYCINGLVVEGNNEIKKIGFGVSFNGPFLERSIASGCDAVLVHHGIFQKRFFILKGIERRRMKKLLDNDISLFGIHLPMDAHPEIGHNSLLLKEIGCKITGFLKWGFFGENEEKNSLENIIDIFHKFLHPDGFLSDDMGASDDEFNIERKGCVARQRRVSCNFSTPWRTWNDY